MENKLNASSTSNQIDSNLIPDLYQIPTTGELGPTQMMSSTEGTHDILNYVNMRNHIMENDGRLHSLRHRLNGPYVCPKCNSCFLTSQLFASHAVARHYKYETAAQRAQRRRTRYERSQNIRNRRLVTVVSERRSGSQRRNKPELPVVAEGQGQSTQLKREAKDQPN